MKKLDLNQKNPLFSYKQKNDLSMISRKIKCLLLAFSILPFSVIGKKIERSLCAHPTFYQKHVAPIVIAQSQRLLSHQEFAQLLKKHSVRAIPFEETKHELAKGPSLYIKQKHKKRGRYIPL